LGCVPAPCSDFHRGHYVTLEKKNGGGGGTLGGLKDGGKNWSVVK